VASEAEDRQRLKYNSQSSASYCFNPVAVETIGTLGVDTTDLIRRLGSRVGQLERLSVSVQRGNAAAVLGTVGLEASRLDAVFYF